MKEAPFESSSLWQCTLGSDRAGDKYERDRLKSSYLAARNNATALLNELSHSTPNFTVHDISHVDALWETAGMICGSSVTLTPAEAYVLGCAFIFHDAAMGAVAYRESIPATIGLRRWHDLLASFIVQETGQWPTRDDLDSPAEETVRACTEHAIRDLHAAHAALLVDQPWTSSAGNQIHLVEDLQLRESYGPLIGQLAASHWWPVERLHREFKRGRGSLPWQPPDWIVDPLKLACILRLADATQLDSRRAPTFLFALRRPEGNSHRHWRFQEHVARPQLLGDRVTYTSWRHFEAEDADAWWLALDYLRSVDEELKAVDALLHDLDKPRFEARAVAAVDSPERFAELFPVKGWRPVDARINVSDVPHLVETLGGEQLYGKQPEVALRELLQNAQDAVSARQSLEPGFADPHISVSLEESHGEWVLEVADHGVGMDEEILASALLDFGRSGWMTPSVRNTFVGLADGGFRPRGRFGIGFFSVFMLGDDVEVVSRRFDKAHGDARRLRFRGVRARPVLTPTGPDERPHAGTRIRVTLRLSPFDTNGLFHRTYDDSLTELVQRLCPERSITMRVTDWNDTGPHALPLADLRSADPGGAFDMLYPPVKLGGTIGEKQRLALRAAFEERATEIVDEKGGRIGLAALGQDFYLSGPRDIQGAVLVNGLRADDYFYFAGYLEGKPSKASRDKAELVAEKAELRAWMSTQVDRQRELNLFDPSVRLELGYSLNVANVELDEDHPVAFVGDGLLSIGQFAAWASERAEILVSQGWPISFDTRPPRLVHYPTGTQVTLPDGWIFPAPSLAHNVLDDVFGLNTDPEYESARLQPSLTWQKTWWRLSGRVEGVVFRLLCRAWSCDIADLLEPVGRRGWNDFEDCGYPQIGPVPVYRLRRP